VANAKTSIEIERAEGGLESLMSGFSLRGFELSLLFSGQLKPVLRALQSSHALEVLFCLAEEPTDVQTLADRLEIDYSAVSKALGRLRSLKLVTMWRDKRRHLYCLGNAITFGRGDGQITLQFKSEQGASLVLALPTDDLSKGYDLKVARITLDQRRSLLP